MTMRIGGLKRKTRKKLLKHVRERGKLSVRRYFQKFELGDEVRIKIEPSILKGMPHPDFQGLSGRVVGVQGDCYIVEVKDKRKKKKLIIHPVHLRRIVKEKVVKSKVEKKVSKKSEGEKKAEKKEGIPKK